MLQHFPVYQLRAFLLGSPLPYENRQGSFFRPANFSPLLGLQDLAFKAYTAVREPRPFSSPVGIVTRLGLEVMVLGIARTRNVARIHASVSSQQPKNVVGQQGPDVAEIKRVQVECSMRMPACTDDLLHEPQKSNNYTGCHTIQCGAPAMCVRSVNSVARFPILASRRVTTVGRLDCTG